MVFVSQKKLIPEAEKMKIRHHCDDLIDIHHKSYESRKMMRMLVTMTLIRSRKCNLSEYFIYYNGIDAHRMFSLLEKSSNINLNVCMDKQGDNK